LAATGSLMKKICLTLSSLFFVTILYAQAKSVLTEIHINAFAYKGDTLKLATPKVISVNKLGCSAIFSIGKINNNEFAIQLETMLSQLGQAERLVVGKVFYKKNGTEWERLFEPEYYEEMYNIQRNGKNNNQYEFGYAGGSYGADEFYIDYLERYTVLK